MDQMAHNETICNVAAPHPKLAEQLKDLQELARAHEQLECTALRERNEGVMVVKQEAANRCLELEREVVRLEKTLVAREQMISRLKELFIAQRSTISHTSICLPQPDDAENVFPTETSQKQFQKPPEGSKAGQSTKAKRKGQLQERTGISGGRLEEERARLASVDAKRRSVQQRRESDAAYQKALKSKDAEIKHLKMQLAKFKEQVESDGMRHEQELYIARQSLKHINQS